LTEADICHLTDKILIDKSYDSKYFSCVDCTSENTMDESTKPALNATSSTDLQPESAGQLQTITDACAAMKDQIANEAQSIISGTDKMGKPPTITEACSVMKDQIADEAQHIVGVPVINTGHKVAADGTKGVSAVPEYIENNSAGIANSSDAERPHRKELEQAKRALKEANWFEQ
jgi:hypothetical protein